MPDQAHPTMSADVIAAERLRRKHELALSYRLFAAMRWGDMGDGHITARDPEHLDCFWVLGYPVSFDRATVDDLVLIGPDGSIVEAHGPFKNTSFNTTAYYIHWPIHEARSDVVAAAHTHTQWGTPFAAERRLLGAISQEACAFHGDHSLFDDEEVQVLGVDGGKRIASALGENMAVILANHGLLTTGASVAEAVGAFVMMERVCEAHLKAHNPLPISDDGAQRAKDGLRLPASYGEAFKFLVARHLPDVTDVW